MWQAADVGEFRPVFDRGIVLFPSLVPSAIFASHFQGLKLNNNLETIYLKYLSSFYKSNSSCFMGEGESTLLPCVFPLKCQPLGADRPEPEFFRHHLLSCVTLGKTLPQSQFLQLQTKDNRPPSKGCCKDQQNKMR